MFGRPKATTPQQEPAAAAVEEVRLGGKGRPTPKRREVEQRNRRPIVGATAAAAGTKAERKAVRAAQRDALRAERARTRQALITGDERGLPLRDRGPAKRFARDAVDSRHNIGEYFLPVALLAVILSLLPLGRLSLLSLLLIYGTGLLVALDCFLLRRRVQRQAEERFGATQAQGTGTYAMMRALQLRRSRLPRPQVDRGSLLRR